MGLQPPARHRDTSSEMSLNVLNVDVHSPQVRLYDAAAGGCASALLLLRRRLVSLQQQQLLVAVLPYVMGSL